MLDTTHAGRTCRGFTALGAGTECSWEGLLCMLSNIFTSSQFTQVQLCHALTHRSHLSSIPGDSMISLQKGGILTSQECQEVHIRHSSSQCRGLVGTALLPGLAAVAAYCKRIASGDGGVRRSNTEMTHVMMKKVRPLSLMQTFRRCGSAQQKSQTMYRMLTLPRTACQLLHSPAVANVRSQHRPALVAGT
jgi:hypothetical protein